MNITAFVFFVFIGIVALLYYIVPKKARWIVLLAANIYFLSQANDLLMNGFWLLCALVTYVGARLVEGNRETHPGRAKALAAVSVLIVIGFMIVLKDSSFFVGLYNNVTGLLGLQPAPMPSFPAPMGISYYSLIWTGYLIEVYCGTCACEKNILKFLTFCGYFPIYTAGPIVRFQDVESNILEGHSFDYKRFTFGLQRILWGLMKKLILSERLAIVVNKVYEDSYAYPGFYVWIAMILFVFQLYTDFSGCIDIVLGVSEMLGIELPENFSFPFLAQSMSEFWRCWHITLGGWLRDYILYPILKSDGMQKLAGRCKKRYGKKMGKSIPTWIGLLISWFLIGFWHGGQWNYILGVGLFCGVIIITGEMLAPVFARLKNVLKINDKTFAYRCFQRLRTFLLFTVALSFFRAYDGLEQGFLVWKNGLTVYNPWILTDGSLLRLGLDQKDINILWFFGTILAVSGILSYVKKQSLRELIARQNLVFRWILYLFLLYSVIIFGCYGINFDSAAFIYQKF